MPVIRSPPLPLNRPLPPVIGPQTLGIGENLRCCRRHRRSRSFCGFWLSSATARGAPNRPRGDRMRGCFAAPAGWLKISFIVESASNAEPSAQTLL